MVGAVLVRDGRVVGEGFHRRPGEAHAEIVALAAAGERARGATLFLNLEPCSHHGRTPPCADALVAAGITRVVACHRDPDPRVSGRGFERLRAAGIVVDVGELAEDAVELNFRFLVNRVFERPQVTLKWAMSLDGKIATATGESQWISGTAARRWALSLREEHDAILVGIGTVLADDPRLDRRLGRSGVPILRVLLDRHLRTPFAAKLFGVPGPVVIYCESHDEERACRLRERGAEVVVLPEVSPVTALADLGGRGVASLLVEGGREVATAFFAAGLFDRLEVAVAGRLLAGQTAPGPLGGRGVERLAEAPSVDRLKARKCGSDLVLSGFNSKCLRELFANLGL
jgi:diaminohydroxyphosphoribosylaminopyrimidine deaminase/5-amino-6-(5-phosphoribosylamino)uracil reductase